MNTTFALKAREIQSQTDGQTLKSVAGSGRLAHGPGSENGMCRFGMAEFHGSTPYRLWLCSDDPFKGIPLDCHSGAKLPSPHYFAQAVNMNTACARRYRQIHEVFNVIPD